MRMMAKALLLLAFTFALGAGVKAQRISFDMLKGNWEVNGSRDLKIYGDYKLHFNGINAHCYLKSTWTFDSDSTGYITVKSSSKCTEPSTSRFRFRLFESPGYGGPVYKMEVHFDNGTSDKLALESEDGQKKLKIAYNQAIVESMATDNRVWIYYSLKKKD